MVGGTGRILMPGTARGGRRLSVPTIHAVLLSAAVLSCGRPVRGPERPGSGSDVANPFPVDALFAMSGRYRLDDGSLRIAFDPQDVVSSPIQFRGATLGHLEPGAFDLYVEVDRDDVASVRKRLEVGLGDSISLLLYAAPSSPKWVGPIRLTPTVAASSVEFRGDTQVRLRNLWLQPAGAPVPRSIGKPVPNLREPAWETVWIDVPDASRGGGWFTPGKSVTVRIRGATRGTSVGTAAVTCSILDFDHHEVGTHRFTVRLGDGGGRQNSERIPVPERFGPYLLRFLVHLPHGGSLEFQRVVARVSAPLLFGTDLIGGHGNPRLLAMVGGKWNRKWDTGGAETTWSKVESKQGRYSLATVTDSDATEILGVLDSPPTWVGTQDARSWREHWLTYVRRVVSFHRGRVRAWEIFNEPYEWAAEPWISAHVATVEATAQAIREADPGAKVVSGGPSEELFGGLVWWDELARAGLLRSLDVISVHMYLGRGGTRPIDTDIRFHAYATELRKLVDAHGGRGKPIWDTESGLCPNESFYIGRKVSYGYWDANGFTPHAPVPYRVGAAMATRLLLVHIWHRIRWFYYQAEPSYGNSWALVDFDGSPLPLAVGMAQMVRLLHDAEADGLPELPAGFFGLRFSRGSVSIVGIWATGLPPGAVREVEIVASDGVQMRDMFGNALPGAGRRSIGLEPILLVGPGALVDRAVASLKLRQ